MHSIADVVMPQLDMTTIEGTREMRRAHYIVSSHWDREWYDTFQGYRMRLVSLLDEAFDIQDRDPDFKTFVMDGQVIPILDYLEVRPDKQQDLRQRVIRNALKLGPWYTLPDEWLVSGESIVRNLQLGIALASQLGGQASRAGLACDQFGHIGQLPQIFSQLGIAMAFVWRGTHEREHHGHFNWCSPDGTSIPTYRFGTVGYSTLGWSVRQCGSPASFTLPDAVERLVEFTLQEAQRSNLGPILLFDGGDHIEAEPQTSRMIAAANVKLRKNNIQIVHSDLDAYMAEVQLEKAAIERTLKGELRESGRDDIDADRQWLIPGVLSSRIHLKQRNAACEDELCLWAEPFSSFASHHLGIEYPAGFLSIAWKHLLENHSHDSICGCSIDQVHEDMVYRFDQSIGISSRLTSKALSAITAAAAPRNDLPGEALVIGVFNCTSTDINEAVDLEVALPAHWPKTFQEFFGYEKKFAFRVYGPDGKEIPYQLLSQEHDRPGYRRERYKFPVPDHRHVVRITAPLHVPSCGYTTLTAHPAKPPTRHLGSMTSSHRSMENEFLAVQVNDNGTIRIDDKRTGKRFDDLLTFEQRADIGDGWFHGLAVNDETYLSTCSPAQVAIVADGRFKATFRVAVNMRVPEMFDFANQRRSTTHRSLHIVSDITLRQGCDRVEVTTTVDNSVKDHRLRVLFPTDLTGDTYLADSAFDVVERTVPLAADNDYRRELDVDGRPQVTLTAFGDGKHGLSVISRGIPESAIVGAPCRTIALTLLRAFRRAVYAGDSEGGQMEGSHQFRYWLVPYGEQFNVDKLLRLGQRVNSSCRQETLAVNAADAGQGAHQNLARSGSFLRLEGSAVISSIQARDTATAIRLFNPTNQSHRITLEFCNRIRKAKTVMLDGGSPSVLPQPTVTGYNVIATIAPHAIITIEVAFEFENLVGGPPDIKSPRGM